MTFWSRFFWIFFLWTLIILLLALFTVFWKIQKKVFFFLGFYLSWWLFLWIFSFFFFWMNLFTCFWLLLLRLVSIDVQQKRVAMLGRRDVCRRCWNCLLLTCYLLAMYLFLFFLNAFFWRLIKLYEKIRLFFKLYFLFLIFLWILLFLDGLLLLWYPLLFEFSIDSTMIGDFHTSSLFSCFFFFLCSFCKHVRSVNGTFSSDHCSNYYGILW